MEINLVLGKKCNLRCQFCTHTTMNVADEGGISITAMLYLKAVGDCIVFYGGEPLMYWDDIVQVIENTNAKEYATFTNGKLLNRDKVKYCNDNNIMVILSWDGNNSEELRGYNAIEKNWKNILAVNDLKISCVISEKSYPLEVLNALDELEQEYYKKHSYYFRIQLSLLRENKPLPTLNGIDYDRIDKEVQEIIHGYDDKVAYKIFLDGLEAKYKRELPADALDCSFGRSKLAIDRKGNYFACLGYDKVVGNVTETSVPKALSLVKEYDKYPQRYDTICAKCEAKPICMNGCVCYKAEQLDVFCELRKRVYAPIIDFFKTKG